MVIGEHSPEANRVLDEFLTEYCDWFMENVYPFLEAVSVSDAPVSVQVSLGYMEAPATES